jgi:hypothetical protein
MRGSKKPNRVIMSAARREMKSSNRVPIQIIPKNSVTVARAPVPWWPYTRPMKKMAHRSTPAAMRKFNDTYRLTTGTEVTRQKT